MAKKRMKHPVKMRSKSTLKKTLKAVTEQRQDQQELRSELYEMADKAIKEEHGSMIEWFKMARLEHKAMKRLLVEKGVCTIDEIKKTVEKIKDRK